MSIKKIILFGLRNSLAVAVYTALIAWFLFNGENVFDQAHNFLMPLALLLLFIVSAATTGLLVFLQPILFFVKGLKKEAFQLLATTLSWLVIYLVIIFVVLAI